MSRLAASTAMGLALAALGATPTLAAEAQQTVSDQDAQLAVGDIVVTAQRRAQRLQDVPVAVSVVSQETLQKNQIVTLEAVAARLPNVKISPGALTDSLNIRGVGSGQNVGFEQSVATFVDGVYRGRSRALRAALFDVEQIEVLKGPQTTFFGNNAIAGALNVTSKKPGTEFDYNVSALGGLSDGEFNLEGAVTLPLSPELSVRVAGRYSGMNGYIDYVRSGTKGPHLRDGIGRISVRWQPSDNFLSELRFDKGRFRDTGTLGGELLNCPTPFVAPFGDVCQQFIAFNGGPVDDKLNLKSDAEGSRTDYDYDELVWSNQFSMGSLSLNSISSYFRHRAFDRFNVIPTPVPGGFQQNNIENAKQYTQELRLQSDTGGLFDFMVGGYYAYLKTDWSNRAGFFFLPFGAFNPTGTTDASTLITGYNDLFFKDQTLSGFASATIRPVSGLRINLGARYTDVLKKANRIDAFAAANSLDPRDSTPLDPQTQFIYANFIIGADLGNFPQPRRRDKKFQPSVGIQYDVAPNLMTYATYSSGFKAGGFSSAQYALGFEPETVNAFEVGMKGSLLDRRLTFALDFFRSDYSDLQESTIIFTPGGANISVVRNAATARSQGIEFNTNLRVSPVLTLNADIAYLDAKYRNYRDGACTIVQGGTIPNCVQDMSGKRRPYAPEWSGNVGATLTLPVSENAEFTLSPLVYFTSSFFQSATADPDIAQEGNTKVDLRVGVGATDGRWEFAVIGKNLTDKLTAGYRNPLPNAPGSVFALPDRPRSVAVQFTVRH